MENFYAKNLNEAAGLCYELLKVELENDLRKFLVITGGEFGFEFAKILNSKIINMANKHLILSDERVTHLSTEKNLHIIIKILNKLGSKKNNFYFKFDELNSDYKTNMPILQFMPDYSILSLGDDGHLAGHFHNSIRINKCFCYTDDAPKKPSNRISFRVPWIMAAKKIVIAAMGIHKKDALQEIMEFKGVHGEILKKNEDKVLIISDLFQET
tara:strand:- start:210 stop:848 length:639 start_codon:yes stop_codon:yes gene_type:complete